MILSSKSKVLKTYLEHLKNGKILIYPTETVWGLGVDATNKEAIHSLYEFKKRERKKPLSLLVRDMRFAKEIAVISSSVEKLISLFCPGPVTFVLPLKKKSLKHVSLGSDFIGLRFSSHPLPVLLTWSYKNPITSTSANRSGKKSFSLKELSESSEKIMIASTQALDLDQSSKKRKNSLKKDFKNSSLNLLKKRKTSDKQESAVIQIEGKKITFLRKGSIQPKVFINVSSKLGFKSHSK